MPQTIPFEPRELETYKNSYELILVVRDALAAHEAYYKAGCLHGHISTMSFMLVDSPGSEGELALKGLLIDLDDADDFEWPTKKTAAATQPEPATASGSTSTQATAAPELPILDVD